MNITHNDWTIEHLKDHLQAAIDLEFWTIPFYMSAMYSIKDRSSSAYQMLRTVVNQEMLHLQCAANIANAYGLSPAIHIPPYKGKVIPHLCFSPKVTDAYEPYTAEIGPLNLEHINAMCLIEHPENEKNQLEQGESLLKSNIKEYPSIGAFYKALRIGAERFKDSIQGGRRQVNHFSAFYRNMPNMTITESGAVGFDQIALLIDLIVNQGEGDSDKDGKISPAFQNTADDTKPTEDHFKKFTEMKKSLPGTYTSQQKCKDDQLHPLQLNLIKQFDELRNLLEKLFEGENPEDFLPVMASVGGAIRNCWHHGVAPKYSGKKADMSSNSELKQDERQVKKSIIYSWVEQISQV